jgi:hypothetical protein
MSLNSSGLTPSAASTAVSAASGVWLRRVLLAVAAFETLNGLIDLAAFSPDLNNESPLASSAQARGGRGATEKAGNEHCNDPAGGRCIRHACKLGFEGIVSKRLSSLYRSGRSRDWLKMKNSDAPAVKREAEEGWGRERRR